MNKINVKDIKISELILLEKQGTKGKVFVIDRNKQVSLLKAMKNDYSIK